MTASTDRTRDKIVDEFSAIVGEAETLLNKAATETGDKARDIRSQVESKLLSAKLRLQELEGQAVDRAEGSRARHRRLRPRPPVAGDRRGGGRRLRRRPDDEPPLKPR